MDTMPPIESVIIAGLNNSQTSFEYSMNELAELVKANNMEVKDKLVQNLDRPNAATYFGKGKVEELAEAARAADVHTIVTNDELSPSQIRNLEAATGARLLDRTALILEIFAKRAQSKEAKLQVEIAQLKYRLPRLRTSANQSLDQQTGAGGGSFTNRGSGETKLEMNRRTIENSIAHLRGELDEINKSAVTRRQQRIKNEMPMVALVGYTNAGKSTVMNGLVRNYGVDEDKQVFEKDMLFATLDTSVRRLTLPDQKEFLLSDTVGFVSKLPHNLVESFKSTLAEASQADLLLQVIDYSDPHHQEMMKTTADTLEAIGIKDIPMINIFNKADKMEISYPTMEGENQIIMSAIQPESLDMLTDLIKKIIFKDFVTTTLLIPFTEGNVVAYLNEKANVINTDYVANGTQIEVELSTNDYKRYAKYEL
ncbi:GTP-binding protein HflX [Paucilactobacillus oligofermentans DSM 15707 = LMG 22743]|uniref:GTPase HflX n=1 Tax=Paucilactobacillus oligofermentans DSM 15707 = LMG 22743 TaxID=1423778 RepID=A0A0R1RE47_9LACO|nr:GTPase HflX [Paucilactobacillus oligofermentans]KRL55293.1 GTP-binding protein HflX [Paucilactobacillus oligofermentans DSM 15707 = LMG 22743]CUS25716.1 Putative GTP-binding protein, HflX type [Paucilactobacillus oligofermentans DSM 15707 = LMG 22743]